MKGQIGVIGSINIDLTTITKVFPTQGETVIGDKIMFNNGGKGANVAVASARLGEKTNLFACVGDDDFSMLAISNLKNENVNIKTIKKLNGEKCGIANIILQNGHNRIIIVPGANEKLNYDMISENMETLKKCSIVGGQFEIPATTLYKVSEICKKNGIAFVLNLSPIKPYNKKILDNSTYIIVNEVEITQIPGYNKNNPDEILYKNPNKLILTKGADGVYFHDGKELCHIPAIKVKVKDTTGAGDTFFGAFMVALNNGKSLYDSISFANVCAGLKTTKIGAQTGMPKLQEVLKYIK